MSQPHDHSSTDRNMLFGIFALQMDFIDQDALVSAMHAWVLAKDKPLGQLLLERGQVSPGQLQALELLIAQHVAVHGDDPKRSLEAVSAVPTVPHGLAAVADPEFQASLASWAPANGARPREADRGDGSRYRVLRPHKEGGLGRVFVAEDTELHREVALKEIKPEHADNPVFRGRFLLEGEITGRLEHPGIVPVYGLGVYSDGRPYYAMRFLDKGTLKQAVDDFHTAQAKGLQPLGFHSLDFHRLLRHFVDACKAVAYAHDRGVLHRDLKPGNIMLGNYGETLVVDWGLAKAGVRSRDGGVSVQERTTPPTLHPFSDTDQGPTQFGAMLGTIGYASPEQTAGRLDELAPSSDVYSLGATLYVLLTGRRPFHDATTKDIGDRVQRGQISPARQVKPETPAALDAVCRKAMALRPADRYQSALELATEIEHWLADEPVAAYPEPWMVRAGRWGRRHRTMLVGVGVLLVSVVGALSVTTALIWREERKTAQQKQMADEERVRADHNYEAARDLSLELVVIAESGLAPIRESENVRKSLLDAALRSYSQFLAQRPNDPELQERTARLHRYTAHIHGLVNEVRTAERSYKESIHLLEMLVERFPDEPFHREKLSETLREYANLQGRLGQLPEAKSTLERAIGLAERLSTDYSDGPRYQRTLAAGWLDLAGIQSDMGRFDQSGSAAKKARDLFRKLLDVATEDRHPLDPLLLAASLNRLAVSEREREEIKLARTAHSEAIKILRGLLGKSGINSDDVLHFLGRAIVEQSRTLARIPTSRPAAEKNLALAALRWKELEQRHPNIAMYREWQAIAYREQGQLLVVSKRNDEARSAFEKSRALLEKLTEQFPKSPTYHGELGRTYASLGRLARLATDMARADDWLVKAATALRKALEQSPHRARDRQLLKEVEDEQRKRGARPPFR
jgi:serine/threonine-protein kinase